MEEAVPPRGHGDDENDGYRGRTHGKRLNSTRARDSQPPGGSRPIRVVRIIDRLNVGGPARHVVWLTAGLAPACETVLLSGSVAPGEGDMAYFAQEAGVQPWYIARFTRAPLVTDVLVLLTILRLLFRLRPDIVHTHKAKAGAIGRVAVTIYRWSTPSALWLTPRACRVVHTYHGHVFHGYFGRVTSALVVVIERLLARLCTDVIVVVSEEQRREIHGRFRIGRADQFRIIPLGTDFSGPGDVRGDVRSRVGFATTDFVVGIVGRLTEVKNHALFLHALAAARRSGGRGGVRGLVVGDGHLRPSLTALASSLGLAEDLVFTGGLREMADVYASLDVVALTSVNEGTPLTLIEALATGRPIVSTEVGGVASLMGARHGSEDGITVWDHGMTVPSGDARALARALLWLRDEPGLRHAMGDRGRVFARQKYSKERLLADVEGLYRHMLAS